MPDPTSNSNDPLKPEPGSHQQINALIEKARELLVNDVDRGLAVMREALELAGSQQDTAALAEIHYSLGKLYARIGHLDQTMLHFMQAADYYEKENDFRNHAAALISVGYVYAELGEFATAQQYYLKGYNQVHDKAPDIEALALNNVGNTYLDTGKYEKALEFLNKALPLGKEGGNLEFLNAVLDSLADVHLRMDQPDQALTFAQEAVDLARESKDPLVAENIITLGKVYLAKSDFEKARDCFEEAARIGEQFQNYRAMVRASLMTGVVRRLQGDLLASLKALEYAYKLAQAEEVAMLQIEILQELSKTYKLKGDYRRALNSFERFHEMKESRFNERSDMRLRTLEVLYQVESARKEAELYQLRNVELQREIAERQKTEAALEELATRDEITSLFNRRQFLRLIEKVLQQHNENNRPVAFILFDLDHFKQINDTYGHMAGDHALKAVAEHVNTVTRRLDIVARYGGDEFAIMLPDTNSAQAFQVAERLRRLISDSPILVDGQEISMKISLGIAEAAPGGESMDSLIAHADKALYAAKQAGRNRVVSYTP